MSISLSMTKKEREQWQALVGDHLGWCDQRRDNLAPTSDRKIYNQEAKTFSWQKTHYQRGLK